MTEQTSPVVCRFVETMGHLWESEGLPRIAGRVFGFLTVQGEPCSLDDLAAVLGVSKASVSTDARRLERLGLLQRCHRPADRRDYYSIASDAPERVLAIKLEQLQRFQSALDDLRGLDGLAPAVHDRITQFCRNHHRFVTTLRGLLAEIRRDAISSSQTATTTTR
jgi:DNA-binding transcriptional regulator GbsR (MarR family)